MSSRSPLKLDAAVVWKVLLCSYWLVLVVATHLPNRIASLPINQSDKLVHLAAYGLLAWLLATTWQSSAGRLNGRHLWFVWLAVVLFGAVDELTQPPFGRSANIADWLADAVGAALGVFVFQLVRRTLESK